MKKSTLTLVTAAVLSMATMAHAASPLKLEVFNPGEASIFPVSSALVVGEHEVALIDASSSATMRKRWWAALKPPASR